MSPTSLMMIHNPMTAAFGSKDEMEKAIEMLEEVKESIINAYEIKTNLSRARISHLMDSETWMNAKRAIELGFADAMMNEERATAEMPAFEFSDRAAETALVNKITEKALKDVQEDKPEPESKESPQPEPQKEPQGSAQPEPKETQQPDPIPKHGRSVDELMDRLTLLTY